jgi:alanine transaminase
VLSEDNIAEIINICYENNILIMADEVYQNNVYKQGLKFHSFRKVLSHQSAHIRDNVELMSLNSISKGLMGECGFRGGWLEAHNLEGKVNDELYKLKSIELCSNTVGQVATLLSVEPPKRGVESDATVDLYEREKTEIYNGLRERAELLSKTFNEMRNVTCSEIQGAMYAMPRLHLSQSAIEAAKK